MPFTQTGDGAQNRIQMERHKLRKAAIGLAVFLLFTIGYPLAVDQGYWHYNPYILPLVALAAALLVLYWLLHSDWALKKSWNFTEQRGVAVSIVSFAIVGALIGAALGIGYYGMVRFSKAHIAALLPHDKSASPTPPQPATVATTTQRRPADGTTASQAKAVQPAASSISTPKEPKEGVPTERQDTLRIGDRVEAKKITPSLDVTVTRAASPNLSFVFKDSILFTEGRKRRILGDLTRFRQYLSDSGLKLPEYSVSIGIGSSGESQVSPDIVMLPADKLDKPSETTVAYAEFAIGRLLTCQNSDKSGSASSPMATREMATYFNASFWGGKEGRSTKWVDALWEMRQRFEPKYANFLLANAVNSFSEGPSPFASKSIIASLSPDQLSDYVIYSHLQVAANALDRGAKWPAIQDILSQHGIFLPPGVRQPPHFGTPAVENTAKGIGINTQNISNSTAYGVKCECSLQAVRYARGEVTFAFDRKIEAVVQCGSAPQVHPSDMFVSNLSYDAVPETATLAVITVAFRDSKRGTMEYRQPFYCTISRDDMTGKPRIVKCRESEFE